MRTILLTIFLGCSIMDANATTVYDLAQDFSTMNNPSGVWSYGYKHHYSFHILQKHNRFHAADHGNGCSHWHNFSFEWPHCL